jgi:hypothetical protein
MPSCNIKPKKLRFIKYIWCQMNWHSWGWEECLHFQAAVDMCHTVWLNEVPQEQSNLQGKVPSIDAYVTQRQQSFCSFICQRCL